MVQEELVVLGHLESVGPGGARGEGRDAVEGSGDLDALSRLGDGGGLESPEEGEELVEGRISHQCHYAHQLLKDSSARELGDDGDGHWSDVPPSQISPAEPEFSRPFLVSKNERESLCLFVSTSVPQWIVFLFFGIDIK